MVCQLLSQLRPPRSESRCFRTPWSGKALTSTHYSIGAHTDSQPNWMFISAPI